MFIIGIKHNKIAIFDIVKICGYHDSKIWDMCSIECTSNFWCNFVDAILLAPVNYKFDKEN